MCLPLGKIEWEILGFLLDKIMGLCDPYPFTLISANLCSAIVPGEPVRGRVRIRFPVFFFVLFQIVLDLARSTMPTTGWLAWDQGYKGIGSEH